jgi:energy-converting hydrogenase Eha subunit E
MRIRVTLLALTATLCAVTGTEARSDAVVKTGRFKALNNEVAAGSVALVRLADGRRVLRLLDTNIGPGPALRVYLVRGAVDGNEDVRSFKDLGGLKAHHGNHSYPIPASVNTDRYTTVVIWCEDFSVAFGAARLRRA